jgi:type VI protein secretion system component VasK
MQDDLFALRDAGWCGVAVGAVLAVFGMPIGKRLLGVTGPHMVSDYRWPLRYEARIVLLGLIIFAASVILLWLRRRLIRKDSRRST